MKNNSLSIFTSIIITLILTVSSPVFAIEKENRPILTELFSKETLASILIPNSDWHPFPVAGERNAWNSLPAPARQAHIARGEKVMKHEWPLLPAALFLEFARNGNRSRYERPYFTRRSILGDLVIAECMEGKGRFLDAIANSLWSVCEESTWCLPAHLTVFHGHGPGPGLPDIKDPVVALFSGETAGLLTWTVYLLGDKLNEVSPLLCERIRQEIDSRILTPYLTQNFWWMDKNIRRPNNWNPWCASNCLTAALLMEKDENRRLDMVFKAVTIIDQYIEHYPSDGGCNEGPGYWGRSGGSLFDCLELLHRATDGRINIFKDPLIKEIGRYLYRSRISGDYFVNIGDCGHRVSIDRHLVFRYGKRIADDRLTALAAYNAAERFAENPGISGSMGRQLEALFNISEFLSSESAPPPLLRDVWLPHEDMQVMSAREREGSDEGLFVAAYAAHNGNNHNHNDIGNFIVYADGRPVIVDVGVGTYTAKTFGAGRYDIWTMQSAYHNLPTINGVMQKNGRNFASTDVEYKSDVSSAQLSMDIAGAYPTDAGLNSWLRTVRLNRGKDIQVTDSFSLKMASRDITLSLMTPCKVTLTEPGTLLLTEIQTEQGRQPVSVQVHFDSDKITPELEKIFDTIKDTRMQKAWNNNLTRIRLHAKSSRQNDTWKLSFIQK